MIILQIKQPFLSAVYLNLDIGSRSYSQYVNNGRHDAHLNCSTKSDSGAKLIVAGFFPAEPLGDE